MRANSAFNNASHVLVEPGSKRILSGALNITEQSRLENAASSFLQEIGEWPQSAYEQVQWAKAFAPVLEEVVPRVANIMRRLKEGELVAAYLRGFPQDQAKARLILSSITCLLGMPFNYEGQCGGELVMRLVPVVGSKSNTNSTSGEFKIHTDDAALPRDARTEFINLYGIVNPPGTLTSYAAAADGLAELQPSVVETLREWRYSLRFPTSLGFEEEMWSAPCPIIAGPDDDIEIRFPSYAVRPANEGDAVALAAIEKLAEALNRTAIGFPLDAGCFLSFNNSRGAHRRDAIGDGDRLILRTYSARSLDFLKALTEHSGPIFPIESFAKKIRR